MIFNKRIAYVALFLSPGVSGGGGGGHNIKKIKLQLKPLFDQGVKVNRQTSIMSLQEKQLMGLEKRQKLFKEAALQVEAVY